ncbi:MAG TPA: HlyD family secretion protein [Candidatus Binataceae bacterium]|nr:HlyD family secretion protein [Candidatus Binataceae bacterium]
MPGETHQPEAPAPKRPLRIWLVGGVVALVVLYVAIPRVIVAFKTVSTDDAYVNGHVTFVAPRVPGHVMRVLVDDNNRVHRGDLLVQLDKEPYQVKVDIAQGAVGVAESDLAAAQAKDQSLAGLAHSERYDMTHAIEDLKNQVAELHASVAALQAAEATLIKTRADFDRARALFETRVISRNEFDAFQESYSVAEAQQQKAQQDVYRIRAELGLPPPTKGEDLAKVPPDLDQTFSEVKAAQARLQQTEAQLGVATTFDQSPDKMLADFYKRDPSGNLDVIVSHLLKAAPDVVQAGAKLTEARANLRQAQLNLSYCDVIADIDGVVTRRNVNPGDELLAGQQLMALRSLTEIWVDANFKETQLARLRIGQRADLDVDMYGRRQRFEGRISGFTMGTGSTLALLPAENATGNYVKVVQRLPVRIDLTDYNPDAKPLFIGLSVTPYVYIYEPPTGPDAGKVLQPPMTGLMPVPAPVSR